MKKILYIIPFLTIGIVAVTLALTHKAIFSGQNTLTREETTSSKDLSDYYNQSQQLARGQEPLTTNFLAAGDISLSRNIAQTIKTTGDTGTPFKGLGALLKSTDFNFANLESPFGGHDRFTPKDTLVFNAPSKNVQGLTDFNFKVLTLANNHAFDQGLGGIAFTKKILAENNILVTGTGETLDDAWMPAVYNSKGIKVGFIGASYSSLNDNGKTSNNHVARIEDTERLTSAILNLKSSADFIVVTMHAGTEYTREPNEKQIAFAHAAIDAGADIVIGHHPHWIQTMEQYRGKYIFYSLGNFIFDQSWSQETKEGLALKITLEKTGSQQSAAGVEDLQGNRVPAQLKRIEMIPVIIDNNCCPREALSIEAAEILKKIGVTTSVITP